MPRFSAIVMEHAAEPRNCGRLESAHVVGSACLAGGAPSIVIYLRIEQGRIGQAVFHSYGCGVMTACGSRLTELVHDRALDECRRVCADDLQAALGGLPADKQFCAELAVRALWDALDRWNRLHAPPT